jgi:type IV secretory pathway VirB6-like protein
MNTILSFLIQVLLTVTLTAVIVAYLRPYLRKVLIDLCGTEERAQFWTVFSNVVLIGLPTILALNYRPEASTMEELFFEVAKRLSGTLAGFLFALVCVGFIVSIFALFAPKPANVETK